MKDIRKIEFCAGSREEFLPGFSEEFPYIATRGFIDQYIGRSVPWHWHKAVELFYMESGELEYRTSKEKRVFPAGSGGLVNSNALHATRALSRTEETIQVLHIFDVSLLAGESGGRIEQKYILPLAANFQVEIIPLYPHNPKEAEILKLIRETFQLKEEEFGYEIKLREALAKIWLLLFEQAREQMESGKKYDKNDEKIKEMMIYAHEHYNRKITVEELAASAFLSERECFRAFQNCLHMTPMEYIKNYRLQMACQMLQKGQGSVTEIGHACGLGSSSYFGKVFREYAHCTPLEYRRRFRENEKAAYQD